MIHPNTVPSCTVAGWVTLSSSRLDPHGEGQLFLLLFSLVFIMKASFPTGDPAGRIFPLLKSPKRAESERLYNRSSFLRSDLYLAGSDSSLRLDGVTDDSSGPGSQKTSVISMSVRKRNEIRNSVHREADKRRPVCPRWHTLSHSTDKPYCKNSCRPVKTQIH